MTTIHVRPGEGQHYPMIADFASTVPVDRPAEESMEAILSVTQRHGVRLAGA